MFSSSIFVIVAFAATITYLNATTYVCDRNQGCGCSKYDTTTVNARIVNGEAAAAGTWGWAASLKLNSENPNFCGGTVIDEQHILTAAHCIADLGEYGFSIYDIEVRLGLIDISDPGPHAESYSLESATIHPKYNTHDAAAGYDIAVLTLSRAIDFNRNAFISKVCLPFLNSTPPSDLANPEYPLPNTNLIAIGWGVKREGSHITSDTLQQVTLQAIDKDDSKCRYPADFPIPAQDNNPQIQMCATAPGKDTCQGDSGGPLLMFRPDTKVWELVGVTSFGQGCAEASYSGVYTRVAAYLDWIKQNAPTPAPTQATTPASTPGSTQATTPASTPVPTQSTTREPSTQSTTRAPSTQSTTRGPSTQSTPVKSSTTPYYNGAQPLRGFDGLINFRICLVLRAGTRVDFVDLAEVDPEPVCTILCDITLSSCVTLHSSKLVVTDPLET
ncbi:unnamed protein product [Adineta ricciae]|uniref:Peptidase S1 domain-containing protein n=1 Tax=Adineta ricciae TaxID=249248 RepID=A0A815K0W9_ADIRI|nr:unnamed protein product [Adineta ricciae]CAF1440953.1 unnamed protein product [Adineta ricciae]